MLTQREPQVGDIWAWVSYNDCAYYLILGIEVKEEQHYDSDGTSFTSLHQYFDLMGLQDGKIYADYTCNDMSNHSGWRFIC